ncbi:hypothetical protein [Azospirillum sp. sgz302134]
MHRRELLTTRPSPDARHDYLVELAGEPAPGTRLTVRYVPDRVVMEPGGFGAYLPALADLAAEGLEVLALAVLDDLNNELVPRWAEVTAERTTPLPHRIVVEDRQPTWDNPHLFDRMRKI